MKALTGTIGILLAVLWAVAFPPLHAGDTKQAAIEADRKFAGRTALQNMAAIQFSSLAEEKGTGEFAKQFGAILSKRHSEAMADLKQIASAKSIALPEMLDSPSQSAYNRLSSVSGAGFDAAFRTAIIAELEGAWNTLLSFSSKGHDSELRAYASRYSGIVQSELHMAKAGRIQTADESHFWRPGQKGKLAMKF